MASPQYCTATDLASLGIRPEALRGISIPDITDAIKAAGDEIDGYLGARYELPLRSWGSDLRKHCAKMVVYDLVATRGFNPNRPGDEQIRLGREDALDWLRRISHGEVVPRVVDSSSGATEGTVSGGAQVSSFEGRGYTSDRNGCGGGFTGRRRA